MAFWNSRKENPTSIKVVVDEEFIDRLEKTILLSKESTDRANANVTRGLHELTKSVDKLTKETMRRK